MTELLDPLRAYRDLFGGPCADCVHWHRLEPDGGLGYCSGRPTVAYTHADGGCFLFQRRPQERTVEDPDDQCYGETRGGESRMTNVDPWEDDGPEISLVPGAVYRVTWSDCCISGEFVAAFDRWVVGNGHYRFVRRADLENYLQAHPDDVIDHIEWSNGVAIDSFFPGAIKYERLETDAGR